MCAPGAAAAPRKINAALAALAGNWPIKCCPLVPGPLGIQEDSHFYNVELSECLGSKSTFFKSHREA